MMTEMANIMTMFALEELADRCETMLLHREHDLWCVHLSDEEDHGYKNVSLLSALLSALLEIDKRAAQAEMN